MMMICHLFPEPLQLGSLQVFRNCLLIKPFSFPFYFSCRPDPVAPNARVMFQSMSLKFHPAPISCSNHSYQSILNPSSFFLLLSSGPLLWWFGIHADYFWSGFNCSFFFLAMAALIMDIVQKGIVCLRVTTFKLCGRTEPIDAVFGHRLQFRSGINLKELKTLTVAPCLNC